MSNAKQLLGSQGEELAVEYLIACGYRLACRNYRLRSGEIDIIMYDGAVLVFVEVRTKSAFTHGTPFDTVNYKKRRQIEKTARHYLSRFKISEDVRCRFDVVGISITTNNPPKIEHLTNAFQSGE